MTEKDQFDEQAERLLPCPTYKEVIVCHDPESGITRHAQTCPAWHRPAVAAALREKGKRLADLRAENEKLRSELRDERALTDEDYSKIEIERNDLRADKEQLQRSLDHMNDCCLRAEAERDELKAQLAK